jgi:hypothetical protein
VNGVAYVTRASSRQLLLAVILLGIVGLQVELALLRHADSFQQWIPHAALMIGLLSTLTVYIRPGRGTLRAFQVIMLIFLGVGALGVYLHFIGNVEFARERNPSLGGAALVWKALRGATPALAPGALAQLGLLGLLYSYRHPALGAGSIQNNQNVD